MVDRYNKLVRDLIPTLIEAQGDTPSARVLEEDEYAAALREKLMEEAKEYLAATTPAQRAEELADLLEVACALGALDEQDPARLEALRLEKRKKRGGFEKRLMLLEVERHGPAE